MASTTAICSSFKTDLFSGIHSFYNAADVFRWALYTSTATNGATTTAYSATNEITGTAYVAKGTTTANVNPALDSTTAYVDWPDPTWASATLTAASVLLYNDTVTTPTANVAIYIGDFSGSKSSSSGTFTVTLPGAAYNTALVRLA